MKTPRNILLQRHQVQVSKLDGVRKNVVANLSPGPSGGGPDPFKLLEFVLSLRWHFAGLGAAWVFIFVLNSERPLVSPQTVASQNAPSPLQLLTALQEHRQQLLRWDDEQAISAPSPNPIMPPRRSELQFTNFHSIV
jgi:hypothetical protein